MSLFIHDPDAELDYTFDWAEWLSTGETITDSTVTVSTGLVLESVGESPTEITAWITTNGATGRRSVACRVETSAGRTDERTIQINVHER